jgi:hypothetical protein
MKRAAPARRSRTRRASPNPKLPRQPKPLQIPPDQPNAELALGVQKVSLTNLQKMFWPEDRITKRDLLQYYADISPFLLPHLAGRAMVMKRYPDGAAGPFFFQKRAPDPRPKWILLNHAGFTSSMPSADRKTVTQKLEQLIQSPGFTGAAPGGTAQTQAGGGSSIRSLYRRALSAWDQVPALAPRQSPAPMHHAAGGV